MDIGSDVRDESSESDREAAMPGPKPTDCPPGEPREVCDPRTTVNGGLNAKVSRILTDIGVEMADTCFSVVFFLLNKEVLSVIQE